MRIIGPIILIVVAAGLFFGLGEPMFNDISAQRAQLDAFNQALDNAAKFRSVRDDLNARYSRISPDQLSRLNKMLPSDLGNIHLINDINSVATRNGMILKSVNLEAPTNDVAQGVSSTGNVDAATIRLSASGTYRALRGFISELEKSLRLVDVTSLTFSSKDTDVYSYEMDIRTYWIKQP